jgi:hypothetical protein
MLHWNTAPPTVNFLDIVRAEYREMPGLTLTLPQARRLWNLADEECAAVLEDLVAEGFLRRTRDGAYQRPFE